MGFLNTALKFTGNDVIVDLFPNHKHLHSETPYRTGVQFNRRCTLQNYGWSSFSCGTAK